MNNALDDLLYRLGAIVPLSELERVCGARITRELLATRQVVTVGETGTRVTASGWLRDPRCT